MRKKILSGFVLGIQIIVPLVVGIGIGFHARSRQDFQPLPSTKCEAKIPRDYCDPSIKSLEQELKIAFYKNDKCIEALSGDKKAMLDKVNRAEQEVNYWKDKVEYMQKLGALLATSCKTEVESCRNQLESCQSGSPPGE